jgi:hypothetical protein
LSSFAFELAPRLYEQVGRNAKLLRDRDQIGLVRLEKANQRCKETSLAETPAKLVCPDSGQVDEPFGASFVTKHCRKRGKAQCDGVVWSRGLYHVD